MGRAREIADLIGGTTPDIILKTSDGAILNLQTSDTTVAADGVLGAINFQAPDEASGTDSILIASKIEAVAEGTFSASSNATSLVFSTASSAAAGTVSGKMTFTSGGNLIIKDTDTADGSSPTITLQSGDTDIAANDVLGSINFQAPDEGTGTDAILVAGGIEAVSEGDFSSSSNATKLSFKTAASAAAAETMALSSAGNLTVAGTFTPTGAITANAGGVVDNITIDGQEIDVSSGDLLIDVAGDITLDAGNFDVFVAAAGTTVGSFQDNNGNFRILATGSDKDLIFRGNDDGTEITALTLDMSAAGLAIFNSGVAIGGTGTANTIDDYEEGTWTPAVVGTTTTPGFSNNSGRYTRIGRIVVLQFFQQTNSSPTAAFTNNAATFSISGIPFSVDGIGYTGSQGSMNAQAFNYTSANNNAGMGADYVSPVVTGGDRLEFRTTGSGQTRGEVNNTGMKAAAYVIEATVTYVTDA